MLEALKCAKSELNIPRTIVSENIGQLPANIANIQFRKSDLSKIRPISGLVQGSIAVRELRKEKRKDREKKGGEEKNG